MADQQPEASARERVAAVFVATHLLAPKAIRSRRCAAEEKLNTQLLNGCLGSSQTIVVR